MTDQQDPRTIKTTRNTVTDIEKISAETARAAITLRCPEGFELLAEGYRKSEADTLEGRLDDALKHIAGQPRDAARE